MSKEKISESSNLKGGTLEENIANLNYETYFKLQLTYLKYLIQEKEKASGKKILKTKQYKKLDEIIENVQVDECNVYDSIHEYIKYKLEEKGLKKVIPYIEICPSKQEFEALSIVKNIQDLYLELLLKTFLPIETFLLKFRVKKSIVTREKVETTLKSECATYYEKLEKVSGRMKTAINGIEFDFQKQTYIKLNLETEEIDYIKMHKNFLYNEASLRISKNVNLGVRVDTSSVAPVIDEFIRYLIILNQFWNDLFWYQMYGYVSFDRNAEDAKSKKSSYSLEYVDEYIKETIIKLHKHSLNLKREEHSLDLEFLTDMYSVKKPLENYLVEIQRLRIN